MSGTVPRGEEGARSDREDGSAIGDDPSRDDARTGSAVAGRADTASARRPDIQGLRAVAVLLVVAFHADLPVPGGFVGVDVFFVISGFVLTRLLVTELEAHGRIRLGSFLARRARRLLPLLALVLAVTVAATTLLTNPFAEPAARRTATWALVYLANVELYRHTGYFDGLADETNPLLHLWSLSVEEQLFLLLPVLLAGTWWARRRLAPGAGPRAALGAAVGVVSALSLLAAWALTTGRSPLAVQAPERLAFYASPTRAWEMGAGALLALAGGAVVARLPRAGAAALGAAGLALVVVTALTLDPFAPFPGLAAVPPVAGTVLVLAAGTASGGVAAVLGTRPLRWVGDRSYGWYLWHWPAVVLARHVWPERAVVPVLAALAALGLAAVTYRLLEDPLRRDVRIVGRRAVALVAVCTLVPGAVIVGSTVATRGGMGLDEPLDWYATPPGRNQGCVLFNRDLANTWPEDRCTTSPPDAEGTVLVVGDTHSDSVTPAVVEAATPRGLRVAQWSRAGCPFVGRTPAHVPRCDEWQHEVLDLVDRLDVRLVVIANRSPDHVDPEDGELVVTRPDGARPGDDAEARGEWGAGLDGVLTTIEGRGIPVVVVAAAPDLGPSFPRRTLSRLRPGVRPPTVPRDEVEARRDPVLAVEQEVVARHPDTRLVDPVPALCDDDRCPAVRDGRWLYFDAHHLTLHGSGLLVDEVEGAMAGLLGPA